VQSPCHLGRQEDSISWTAVDAELAQAAAPPQHGHGGAHVQRWLCAHWAILLVDRVCLPRWCRRLELEGSEVHRQGRPLHLVALPKLIEQ